MTGQRVKALAFALFGLSLVAMVAAAVFLVLSSNAIPFGSDFGVRGFGIVLSLTYGIVGVLIASQRPNNPIGWMCCAGSLLAAVEEVGSHYAVYALMTREGELAGGQFGAWLATWMWVPLTALIGPLMFQLFPNGRLLTSKWRALFVATIVGVAAASLGFAVFPGPLDDVTKVNNPFGLGDPKTMQILLGLGMLAYVVPTILSAISVFLRFRRARGDERQQLKWLVSSAGLIGVSLFLLATFALLDMAGLSLSDALFKTIEFSMILGFLSVPTFTGIAILKYRLYEIDVLLNRTVVYGVLAAFITVAYAAVVIGVGAFVGAGDRSNFFLPLAATALIAILFHPVQERSRRFANRLVYGKRFTPYEALAEFSRRVSNSVSLDEILSNMSEAACAAIGADRARVKVYLTGGGEQAAWYPDQSDDHFDLVQQVFERGTHVGEIAVSKRRNEIPSEAETKLLQDIAALAGPALSNVRLAQDLRASRQRIVAAQDEERRRMERDIHDGAQQQLVAMAVKLSLVKSILKKDPVKAAEMLDGLKAEAGDAVDSLRDLARGIFPPLLRERGLVAALEAHIAKSQLDAMVDADDREMRLRPDAEAALYFVAREALQNAAKHAHGAQVKITLRRADSKLVLEVADSGPGFDPSVRGAGAGLRNMSDRIEALGGELAVDSQSGRGTRVVANLPWELTGQSSQPDLAASQLS